MFSSFVSFFRGPKWECDCCNHNMDFDDLLEEEFETRERQTIKERFQLFLTGLKLKRTKKTTTKRQLSSQKSSIWRYKQIYRKLRQIGKDGDFEVRRKQTRGAINAMADSLEGTDPLKSAVRQLLTAIFTDIVENDHALANQTDATTQCFLVHPLSDLDPNGPFLSRYVRLSPQAFEMDFNLGLSFVSSWLQSSLSKIKTLYPEGEISLQMPFCVLETTQVSANARARALQRLHPSERVGIATLDIEALKSRKLLASAEHTFGFLRVSRQGFPCVRKLLAWAESDEDDENGRSAEALRDAVLTVVEWEESDEVTDGERDEAVGAGETGTALQAPVQDDESEEQWAKWANPPEKKDSGVTSRTASWSSGSGLARSQDMSTSAYGRYPRLRTL